MRSLVIRSCGRSEGRSIVVSEGVVVVTSHVEGGFQVCSRQVTMNILLWTPHLAFLSFHVIALIDLIDDVASCHVGCDRGSPWCHIKLVSPEVAFSLDGLKFLLVLLSLIGRAQILGRRGINEIIVKPCIHGVWSLLILMTGVHVKHLLSDRTSPLTLIPRLFQW